MATDRPGREIPKEYRKIVEKLLDQGWRYDASGKGYPKLFPADKTQRMLTVPNTPSDYRGFKNWQSDIKKAGGQI